MESKCTILLQRQELLAMRELQSKDTSRYILNAVNFEVTKDQVLMIATNGRTIGVLRADAIIENAPPEPLSFTCDFPMVRHLPKPVRKEELGRIRVDYDGANVRFSAGGQTIISKVIDGLYPQWRMIIPHGPIIPSDFNLNPTYLVQFMKVSKTLGGRYDGVRLRAHAPDGITYKDNHATPYSVFLDNQNFYGALMPMRYDEPTMPKWLVEPEPPKPTETKPEESHLQAVA